MPDDRAHNVPSAWRVAACLLVAVGVCAMRADASSLGSADCVPAVTSVSGSEFYVLLASHRLVQPLAQPANMAACSVGVGYTGYCWPTLEVVEWNAAALAPDPTTVALRTRRFDPSSMQFFGVAHTFSPPVVTKSIAGVADGRALAPALVLSHSPGQSFNGLQLRYSPDAYPWVPLASAAALGQPLEPLAGPHPALSLVVCGGGAMAVDARVVQCVMTTDTALTPSADEFAQHFRVTQPVMVLWAELANTFNPPGGATGPAVISIHEGDAASPPGDLTPELTRGVTNEQIATFIGAPEPDRWITTSDFDGQTTLSPGRDYWLVVRDALQWSMLTRVRTGEESLQFDASIGPLMRRMSASAAWTEVPDRSLSFRLIGLPAEAIDVPSLSATRMGFTLLARPSPARGPVELSWAGATDRVRIDVLDVSGRVLGSVLERGGVSGSWLWDGQLTNGRRLAGGVYLLRASSGSSPPATQRVVLIR